MTSKPTPSKPSNETHPERSTTVQEMLERRTYMPWIRLRGLWLAKAGFPPNTKVRVRVMHGCLVITKD